MIIRYNDRRGRSIGSCCFDRDVQLLLLILVVIIAWGVINFAIWILIAIAIIILIVIGLDFLIGIFSRMGL